MLPVTAPHAALAGNIKLPGKIKTMTKQPNWIAIRRFRPRSPNLDVLMQIPGLLVRRPGAHSEAQSEPSQGGHLYTTKSVVFNIRQIRSPFLAVIQITPHREMRLFFSGSLSPRRYRMPNPPPSHRMSSLLLTRGFPLPLGPRVSINHNYVNRRKLHSHQVSVFFSPTFAATLPIISPAWRTMVP
jgi:hypothetical protein